MTREQAKQLIIESLRRFARLGDEPLTGKTRPIPDLDLESQDGISWSIDLEDLGFMVPGKLNPFVDDANRRARTIDQIVDFLYSFVA